MRNIGVDIGGTSIKAGLYENGLLLMKTSSLTPKEGRESVFAALYRLLDLLGVKDVETIGIVSAGEIDEKRGVSLRTVNIPGWSGAPIKETIERRYGIPTSVDNDAIGALIGECHFLPGYSNAAIITFGTGIGYARLYGGHVDRETRIEWGHRELVKGGRVCGCGKNGCVETYLSASALAKEATTAYSQDVCAQELFGLYERGEEKAKAIVSRFKENLNAFLNLVLTEDKPDIMILDGGLMNSQEQIRKLITISPEKYCFGSLHNEAGMFGAMLLGSKQR
jgi:Transcriptional regulator/sugar kinase